MKSINLKEAKAGFSAIIDAAERGLPTTITKHGRPAAIIVPIADAARNYPVDRPSFGEFLLSFPGGGIEFERNPSPSREIDL